MVSLFPHPASFRSRLTADTLAFGCILPTTGRIRDFHPLETCAAGRTKKTAASRPAPRPEMLLFCDDGLCMNRKVNQQV